MAGLTEPEIDEITAATLQVLEQRAEIYRAGRAPRRVRLGQVLEEPNNPILLEAERQLQEYFAGRRRRFSVHEP